jgi:hypothetical protein
MRGILLSSLCGLICLAGPARASSSNLVQPTGGARHSSADAAYEADEAAMLRSVAGEAVRLAGGGQACINLHLVAQSQNAEAVVRRAAHDAREARSPGFHRVERALAREGARSATTDRDLDFRDVAGVHGAGGSLVERCPAGEVFTFLRAVQAGETAFFEGSGGTGCSSRMLFIALRKRGRAWQVEGDYSEWIPGGLGCGIAYPGHQAPTGRYLLVGG